MHAEDLHREAVVFDGHYDRLYQTPEQAHDDLAVLREGGITAHIRQSFVGDILQFLERTHQAAERWPDEMVVATSADHVEEAKHRGQVATILSIEGVEPLGGDPTMLRLLYRLGLRNMGVTWNNRNDAADGVMQARSGGGLTDFGVEVVRLARELGVMVDIAHLSPAGVQDVLEVYEGPVVASHANAKAVCDHSRNLDDRQLEGVARSGGLVGVTLVPQFISSDPLDAGLEGLLDHVDHIVRVAGIEHVGLGSDWDGFKMVEGFFMQDIVDMPQITAGLVDRGYDRSGVLAILGGNWLRVVRRIVG